MCRKFFHRRWPLVLPALLFLPFLRDFVYLPGAAYSDLTVSHFPNLVYFRRALLEFQTIPLWSPAILGGFPFFANPLSGLWYPPGWLGVLFPAPWAFNLTAALHLVFGAWGMARLLESSGLGRHAALFGGAAFGMMPKLLAHFAAGHITLVYAVAWTPWLLLAERRYLRGIFRPAVVLAVIFMADPRWAVYAGVLWAAYSFAHSQGEVMEEPGRSGRRSRHSGLRVHPWFRRLIPDTLLAAALSAPLLLPMLEYTRLSTRAALLPGETLAFSFPPLRLLGLFFPTPDAEWQVYPGGLVLVLALAAFVIPAVRRRARFWGWAAPAALLFAMGEMVPILRLWAELPGANVFRVPARALFIFGICLVVLAAYALDGLLEKPADARVKRRVGRLLVVLAAGWLAFLVGAPALGLQAVAGVFGLAAAGATALLFAEPVGDPARWRAGLPVLLLGVLFADAAWTSDFLFDPRPAEIVFAEGEAAARWLAGQPGRFRVYSPDYSIPQHTAARYGLELASGVDPLQPAAYADFLVEAAGMTPGGYSIPLPPLDPDPPYAVPDPVQLAQLNARYVVAAHPIAHDLLALEESLDGVYIYRNLAEAAPGRMTLATGEVLLLGGEAVDWQPNRIDVRIGAFDRMVLSETDYPGWNVAGARVLSPEAGVFRAVQGDETVSVVTWVFRPVSLYAGLALAAGGSFYVILDRRRDDA